MIETILQDLRYALRSLRKTPGFAIVAILTLALPICANTAIFSIVKAVLLRPLPFAQPDRLVEIRSLDLKTGKQGDWVVYRDIADWREQNHSFESIAGSSFFFLYHTGPGGAEALYGARITSNLLSTLGAEPALGRGFLPSDDQPGNNHVVILSDSTWQSLYQKDPGIIGKKVKLTGPVDQQEYEVIGVMPAGFNYPLTIPTAVNPPTRQMAFWTPFGVDILRQNRNGVNCLTVARLRPGVRLNQAQADMDLVTGRLEHEYPETNTGRRVRLVSLLDYVLGSARQAMLIVWGATGLVILIGCVNIANLLLARATNRRRETGIRLALGAGRSRLTRQWLTESLLLSFLGGIVGLLVALMLLNLLVKLAPQTIPRLSDVQIDFSVLGDTIGISVFAGLLFGILPAWHSAGIDPQEALREGGGRTAGTGRKRTRELLIIAEVALCVPLTIGAGLLVRSFVQLTNADIGFRADHLLTSIIVLPNGRYPDRASKIQFFHKLLDGIRALPGVESTGYVDGVPLSGNITGSPIAIEGRPSVLLGDDRPAVEVFTVSPDYLSTMGIPLLAGRQLDSMDEAGKLKVAVINDIAAKQFWQGEDPLGKRLKLENSSEPESWLQVVGVVKGTRDFALDQPARAAIYVSPELGPSSPQFLAVRAKMPALELAPRVREAVSAVDKDQPVFLVTSMEELLENSTASRRYSAWMLSIFGLLATLLAAIGIYGVTAYSVGSRTQEIGIRRALGASKLAILRLIVGQGMIKALIGVAIGLATAFALSRLIATLLYGVSATDYATYGLATTTLIVITLVACFIPAWRATKVDPIVALRHE